MKLRRRQSLHLAAGAATLPIMPGSAWAEAYPARLDDLAVEPMRKTPAQFGQFLAAENEKWGGVIRAAKIKLN